MHSSSDRIRPWAIVEISGGSDERQRTELIRAAYRSSGAGLIALALRGVTRKVVDRALDPVVDARHDRLQGVVYFDADETPAVLLQVARHAAVVIAATESFRAELHNHGIEAITVEEGAQILRAAPQVARI